MHAVSENVFAMCFVAGPQNNGTITVGGVDQQYYHGDVKYVDNTGTYYAYSFAPALNTLLLKVVFCFYCSLLTTTLLKSKT
jgi:hypothetical protein